MKKNWTKAELIDEIARERAKLEATIGALSRQDLAKPGVTDAGWAVKDVLAHLFDWEQRFLGWYTAGLRGQIVQLPAPQMTWGDLPDLNQQIFEKYRRRSVDEIFTESRTSYRKILKTVQTFSDADLATPGRFTWTGKWTLGDLVAGNTCQHYGWATTLIRKWAKRQ